MTAALQRALVESDGSLTRLLEALAGDAIRAVKLDQGFDLAQDGDAPLNMEPGGAVLRRRAVLRGRLGGPNLLYADTVLAPQRLAPAILRGLTSTDKPIGVLLAEARTDIFQELLDVRRQPAGPAGRHFGIDPAAGVVVRKRRLISGGQPTMVITEAFAPILFDEVFFDGLLSMKRACVSS